MAEQRFVKYGDRELPLPEGVTLDESKDMMRRFFPELADPKVETTKKGEKTVYVFSKKAGTKGADPDAAAIRQRLERVKPKPIDPRLVSLARDRAARAALAENIDRSLGLLAFHRTAAEEAERVRQMRQQLADLPVAPGVQQGSIL